MTHTADISTQFLTANKMKQQQQRQKHEHMEMLDRIFFTKYSVGEKREYMGISVMELHKIYPFQWTFFVLATGLHI